MKLVTTLKNLKDAGLLGRSTLSVILCKSLNQDIKKPDLNTEVSLRFILENNGLHDAMLALRCFPEIEKEYLWYTLECAERVSHLFDDNKNIKLLNVFRKYLNGKATLDEAIKAKKDTERWKKIQEGIDKGLVIWSKEDDLNDQITSLTWFILCETIRKSESKDMENELLRLIDCYERGKKYVIKKRKNGY